MKKLSKPLSLILVLVSFLFLNSICFAKHIDKSSSSQIPIEYKMRKIDDNKTQVDIIMHIPDSPQKTKNVKFINPQNKEILNLGEKVSKINIDGKPYMKIEFSYILKTKNEAKKSFIWPVPGFETITSGFNDKEGRKHAHGAIDIWGKNIKNSKVIAANAGKVITANKKGDGGGYGHYVVIDHGNGKSTLYAHLKKVSVKTGENVSIGQKIGTVGKTGFAQCPHLHFEYRVNGVKTDPLNILDID